jgi:hypothetical protein
VEKEHLFWLLSNGDKLRPQRLLLERLRRLQNGRLRPQSDVKLLRLVLRRML